MIGNRVWETTSTTGTGFYTLLGATSGRRTFVGGIGGGLQCYYTATNGVDWEVGRGTITAGSPDTLVRTQILASSNGGAAVNWGAGTKNIFCDLPAERAAFYDQNQRLLAQHDGTAALPSIARATDPDTGIFWPAANTLGFAIGGAELVRMNAQVLGIGTGASTAGAGTRRVDIGIAGGTVQGVPLTIWNTTDGRGAGLGGVISLHKWANGAASYGPYQPNDVGLNATWADLNIGTETNHVMRFYTANTERGRVDGAGRFLLNHTAAQALYGAGTECIFNIAGTNLYGATAYMTRWANTLHGPAIGMGKSRGTAVGTRGATLAGDIAFTLTGFLDDGTNFLETGSIQVRAINDASTNSVQGRFMFFLRNGVGVSQALGIDAGGLIRLFGDGSTSTPALAWDADPDTGLRRVGANDLGLVVGGVDALRANADGVGIGTAPVAGRSLVAGGTGGIRVPSGTTAQRPSSPVAGELRFNSSNSSYEGHNGTDWLTLSAGTRGGIVFRRNGTGTTTFTSWGIVTGVTRLAAGQYEITTSTMPTDKPIVSVSRSSINYAQATGTSSTTISVNTYSGFSGSATDPSNDDTDRISVLISY